MILCLLGLLCSCKHSSEDQGMLSDAQYRGTFRAIINQIPGPYAHFNLELNAGHIKASTDSIGYPSICNSDGFSQQDNTLTFVNTCFWPDLAGLILLEGPYTINPGSDSIQLVQYISDEREYLISLKKQP